MVYYGSRPNKGLVRDRVMGTLAAVLAGTSGSVQYASLAGPHALDSFRAVAAGASSVVAIECLEPRFRRLKINIAGTPIRPYLGTLGQWGLWDPRPVGARRFLWADFEGGVNQYEIDQLGMLVDVGAVRAGDF